MPFGNRSIIGSHHILIEYFSKALSMDPALDIEIVSNDKKMGPINSSWQISSDEPVRRIKWCSLKVVEETARKMRVFLGGIFERINPLEYHGEERI